MINLAINGIKISVDSVVVRLNDTMPFFILFFHYIFSFHDVVMMIPNYWLSRLRIGYGI